MNIIRHILFITYIFVTITFISGSGKERILERRNSYINEIYLKNKKFSLTTQNNNGPVNENTTLIGRWAREPCYALELTDGYVYYGNGRYLIEADISDPAQPYIVQKIGLPALASNITVDGDYAYVTDGTEGFHIINLRTYIAVWMSYYYAPDIVYDVAVDGDYVYVANGNAGLRIIDISDPRNPFELAYYTVQDDAIEIAVAADRIYIADASSGLSVIDISDPASPVLLGSLTLQSNIEEIVVEDNHAYIANGIDGLRIIDISEPTSLYEKGFFSSGNFTKGVTVQGNRVGLAGDLGFRIIDVSDPAEPVQLGFFDTGSQAYAVTFKNTIAYMANGSDGLRIIDINDPSDLSEVKLSNTGCWARKVVVSGDHAYVGNGGGLNIIDISDPANPFETGIYDINDGFASSRDLAISGNHIYLAYDMMRLNIIDITDKTNPIKISSFHTGNYSMGVAVSGDYAYATDEGRGLRIIDISDPYAPTEVGSSSRNVFEAIAVSSGYAYIAGMEFYIFDVSDPTTPIEVVSYDTPGSLRNIAVDGKYVYVADGDMGLRILDVSSSTNLFEVGFYDTDGRAYGVTVSGDYAYIADGEMGLRVLDISDPTSPYEAGFYDTEGFAYDVIKNNDYIYVADYRGGLYIIQNDLITDQQPEHFTRIWSGNAFQPMNIYCVEALLDENSLDPGDEIGVFDGEKCVGAVKLAATPSQENPINIICSKDDGSGNGFSAGNSISYKIWDASENRELNGNANYIDNTGNPIEPVLFEGLSSVFVKLDASSLEFTQKIPLTTGWNIMSLAVEPHGNQEMLEILDPVRDDLLKVIDEQGNTIEQLFGNWQDYIGDWQPTEGYYIKVSQDTSLELSGIKLTPPALTIDLTEGWNIISYPSIEDYDAELVLQSLIDEQYLEKVIDEQGNTMEQLFGNWHNYIGNLQAGEGYYVKVNSNSSVNINEPESAELNKIIVNRRTIPRHFNIQDNSKPYMPMSIYIMDAEIGGDELKVGDEIGVFQNGNCIGAGVWTETGKNEDPLLIVAGKKYKDGIGFTEGDPLQLKVWQKHLGREVKIDNSSINHLDNFSGSKISSRRYKALGTSVIAIAAERHEALAKPVKYQLYQNYPNPFNPITTIKYDLPENSRVTLSIHNTNGQLIKRLLDSFQNAGAKSIQWNASGLSSGVYYCIIKTENYNKTIKMLLLK